ncbi:phosphoglycerate mutase family [Lachnospiraceae bacterium KM106-2]|nr:phosphoglycerate mutase family [Lachnospiraceae bacterium KM106-2]
MKLYFVRHGETDWNVQLRIQGSTDTCLNENGIRQANELGQKLKDENLKVSKIYSSKQKRAFVTAETVGSYLDLPVEPLEGLEEMNLGLWEGISWVEVEKNYPKEFKLFYENRRYTKTPKGESYQDVLERLFVALKAIIEQGEDAIVVTHSALLYALFSYIHNTPFEEMRDHYHFANAQIYPVDASSLNL